MRFFDGNFTGCNIFSACLLIGSIFFYASCSDEGDTEIRFTVAETERLLSGDSTKTWNLVSREIDDVPVALEGCLLENELIFSRGSGSDERILLFDDSCDESKIFDGYWEVLNQSNLPVTDTLLYLFNPDTVSRDEDSFVVAHDTLVNIVERITSRFLTISRIDTSGRVPVVILENYEIKVE